MAGGEKGQPSFSLVPLLITLYFLVPSAALPTLLTRLNSTQSTPTMPVAHIITFKLKEDVDLSAARKLFERVYEFKVCH